MVTDSSTKQSPYLSLNPLLMSQSLTSSAEDVEVILVVTPTGF